MTREQLIEKLARWTSPVQAVQSWGEGAAEDLEVLERELDEARQDELREQVRESSREGERVARAVRELKPREFLARDA